jgi:hypothetical protein
VNESIKRLSLFNQPSSIETGFFDNQQAIVHRQKPIETGGKISEK